MSEFLTALVASLTAWTTPAPTPCFPDGPPLRASAIYTTLETFSWSLYDAPGVSPPTGTFGTCTVVGNRVTAADGSMVAELGCGVRILKTGILDDLGLEIGATGQDVLDRKPRPHPWLTCVSNGPDQSRCGFDRPPDRDTDGTMYVVDGALSEPITGEKATKHFASRRIVEIHVSVWCH